jgi:hypothetical protein
LFSTTTLLSWVKSISSGIVDAVLFSACIPIYVEMSAQRRTGYKTEWWGIGRGSENILTKLHTSIYIVLLWISANQNIKKGDGCLLRVCVTLSFQ